MRYVRATSPTGVRARFPAILAIIGVGILPAHLIVAEDDTLPPADATTLAAPAEESPQPEIPKRDYRKGFLKFYALELPCVSNAVYVTLDMDKHIPDLSMSMGSRQPAQGNAWMLKEDRANRSVFVVGNCRIVEVYDREFLKKEALARRQTKTAGGKDGNRRPTKARMSAGEATDPRTGGSWKPADLKKDIEKALEAIRKARGDRRQSYQFSYGNAAGNLFLSAIHWSSQGYTNEANEMVGLLFASTKDPREVITQGMEILASSRYSEICDHFFKTGAWADYARDLETLTVRYAGGWQLLGGARKLLAQVKSRAAQPVPPPVAGDGLSAEDQEIARDLATTTNLNSMAYSRSSFYGIQWLLPETNAAARRARGVTNVFTRLIRRGNASLPLLIAMVKDDTLTPIEIQNSGHRFYGRMGHDDETEDVLADRAYNSMRRPTTRGEIAVHILTPLLISKEENPGADMESESSDDPQAMRNEFHSKCTNWHQRIIGKTPIDVARLYATEGNSSQSQAATDYLIRHGTDADMAAVEKRFLESENLMEAGYPAINYIRQRGAKARDFIPKFEATLKEWKPANLEHYPPGYAKKWSQDMLTQLRMLSTTNSASQILQDMLTSTNRNSSALSTYSESLNRTLATETPERAMTLVLEAAVKPQSPDKTLFFVSIAGNIPDLKPPHVAYEELAAMEEDAEDESDENPDRIRISIQPHASLWKQLLADTRLPAGRQYRTPKHRYSVADIAAITVEHLYGERDEDDIPATYRIGRTELGEQLIPIFIARAKAHLAGTPLPAFPSADNVTPDRRKAMADQLIAASDVARLRRLLDGLNMDEQLALREDVKENDKLGEALAPLDKTITQVTATMASAADLKLVNALKDQPISRQRVEQLVDVARRSAAGGKATFCRIERQTLLEGLVLTVTEVDPNSPLLPRPTDPYAAAWLRNRNTQSQPLAMVEARLSSDVAQGFARWAVTSAVARVESPAGPATEDELPAATGDDDLPLMMGTGDPFASSDDSSEDFWKSIEEICAAKGNPLGDISIYIGGTPPSSGTEKKKDNATEDDDEEDFTDNEDVDVAF